MRIFKDFLVFVICFSFLPRVSSEDFCQRLYGEEVALHVSYKDGNQSCCRIRMCPAGSEAVLCSSNNPNSTSCQPCPPDTFQSHPTSSVDMIKCELKQSCDGARMKVEDDDSGVNNRRCLCDLEKGYCNPFRNRSTYSYCQRRYCPFGSQLNQDCSCSECPDGFFKDVNGSMPCKPWRDCRAEGRRTVAKGTTTTDTECGNSTNNRVRGPLPVTKPLMTTTTLSESKSTSDFPKVHSSESRQNSSGSDDTTPQNESSHKWRVAVIAIGIVVAVVLATVVCIILCLNAKRLCALGKPDGQQLGRTPAVVADAEDPLIPPLLNDRILEPKICKEKIQLLNENDPQYQDGCCGDVAPVTVQQAPVSVKDPFPDMTNAMKDSLIKCRVSLLNNLIIDSEFLSVLRINNTLTDDMKQTIQSETTRNSKNDQLLDYLPRRPCLSYKTFVFALVYTRQFNLAQKINAELAEEYKAYVDGDGSVEEKVLSFGCL